MAMTAENTELQEPNKKQEKTDYFIPEKQPEKPRGTDVRELPEFFYTINTFGPFTVGPYKIDKKTDVGKWDKQPPKGTTWNDFNQSLIDAQRYEYLGFKLMKDQRLLVIDIDKPDTLDAKAAMEVLKNNPTYIEYSVSAEEGKPCVKAYYLISDEIVEQIKNQRVDTPVEIFHYNRLLLLTGLPHPLSKPKLATLTETELDFLWIDWKKPLPSEMTNDGISMDHSIDLDKLQDLLSVLPCDFDGDPKLQFACSKLEEPINGRYSWWCTVLAVLRKEQYGRPDHEQIEIENMGLEWSIEDVDHFKDADDYYTTFRSFNRKDNGQRDINTLGTLFQVRKNLTPNYKDPHPVQRKTDKDNNIVRWLPTSLKNIDCFFDWTDFTFYRDVYKRDVRFKGVQFLIDYFNTKESEQLKDDMAKIVTDKDTESSTSRTQPLDTVTTERLGENTVSTGLLDMIQQNSGFMLNEVKEYIGKLAGKRILGKLVYRFNPVIHYAQSGKPYDPKTEPDYLIQYLDCFTIHSSYVERYGELMKGFLRKAYITWYHQMLSPANRAIPRQGWPILIGDEKIGKSMAALFILPPDLRKDYFTDMTVNKHDKSMTELDLKESQHAIVNINELDQFFKDNSPQIIKNRVSNASVSVRDLYEKQYRNAPCRTLIIGSTNARTLQMSDEGNRRMWNIVLHDVDLKAINDIPNQRFHAQLAHLGAQANKAYILRESNLPYNAAHIYELSTEEEDLTNELAYDLAAKTTGDIAIEQALNLDIPWQEAKEDDSTTKDGYVFNPWQKLKSKRPTYTSGGFVTSGVMIQIFKDLKKDQFMDAGHAIKVHKRLIGHYTNSMKMTSWGTSKFEHGILIKPPFAKTSYLYYVPRLRKPVPKSSPFVKEEDDSPSPKDDQREDNTIAAPLNVEEPAPKPVERGPNGMIIKPNRKVW